MCGKSPLSLANTCRLTVLVLCLLQSGCGTLVKGLLEGESRLWGDTDRVLAAAEDLDQGLENPVYDAESAKNEACEPITNAAKERIYGGEPSFVERLWSDLTQVFVLIVPITSVERCAEAQKLYNEELARLCRRLKEQGVNPSCLD